MEAGKTLRTIFLEALEIQDAQERALFLRQACGTDEALRRQVDELLQAEAEAGPFLPEQAAASGLRAVLREASASPRRDNAALSHPVSEQPGDRISRYKLLQKIGEGGCGIVYMAEQEAPVRRRVALKVIKLGMDTRNVVARFEAERQTLALMDHPNIARVLDASATETGRPFHKRRFVVDDDDVGPIELKRGLNVLVVKTVNEPEWKLVGKTSRQASVRFTDKDGNPAKGIKVRLTP